MGIESFNSAVSILTEYMTMRRDEVEDELRFASNSLSLYLINAESENITGFSEVLFRRTIDESLETAAVTDAQKTEVISQHVLGNNSDAYCKLAYRKRRGSVSAIANPFGPIKEFPKPEKTFDFLYGILNNTQLITRTMSPEQMKQLVRTMQLEEVRKGAQVLAQGGFSQKMYLIESGALQKVQDGVPGAVLRGMSIVGEISLLYSFPRTSSVVCIQDARLWVATSDVYTGILMKSQRTQRELTCQVLEEHTEYKGLSLEEKAHVLRSTHLLHVAKDETIKIEEEGVFVLLTDSCTAKIPGSLHKTPDSALREAPEGADLCKSRQQCTHGLKEPPDIETAGGVSEDASPDTSLDLSLISNLSIEKPLNLPFITTKIDQGQLLIKGAIPLKDVTVLFVPKNICEILNLE